MSSSMILAGRLAVHGGLADGWIEVEGEHLAGWATGSPPRPPDARHDGIIAAGFCDLQVNGAAGHEVTGGPEALDAIDRLLLSRGVTRYLPTLISTSSALAERVVEELAERAADPSSPVAGVHLEGPFIDPAHAGMHPHDRLRSPDAGIPAYFGSPAVRLVTLAPELPGALELVAELSGRGVAVALGHSGASAAEAERAVDAGARLVTHVFNAMAPLGHRSPGLAGLALADERLAVGVIADGVHLDPLVLELVRRAAGGRTFLVTDSTAATEAPPGRYLMAGVSIEASEDGGARTGDGRLAGSVLTLDQAVRGWTTLTRATPSEAIAAAGEVPAAAAGLTEGLAPGGSADLVLLDGQGSVERVMYRGRWLA